VRCSATPCTRERERERERKQRGKHCTQRLGDVNVARLVVEFIAVVLDSPSRQSVPRLVPHCLEQPLLLGLVDEVVEHVEALDLNVHATPRTAMISFA
jgi:hypothetical protein